MSGMLYNDNIYIYIYVYIYIYIYLYICIYRGLKLKVLGVSLIASA